MISQLKKSYKKGNITKKEFIDKMHKLHMNLFDFSTSLSDTEISKIEINEGDVIFCFEKDFTNKTVKFYADFNDKRSTSLESFNFDAYESEDSHMIFNLNKQSKVVLDIGSNLGWYSIFLSLMNQNIKIFSFEPVLDIYDSLIKNIELNSIKNIFPNQIALSDSIGKTEMFFSEKQTGATSLRKLVSSQTEKRIIEKTTLDLFVEKSKIEQIDFIKCDVEGGELHVLKGGLDTIREFKPILFFELLRKWAHKFEYHPDEVIQILKELGYSCFKVTNHKLEEIQSISKKENATNFFFLHGVKHSEAIEKSKIT